MAGYFAYSMAGHDKGKIYLIIKEEADYVWLADGRARKLSSPKRKNKKHIQIIKKYGKEAGCESMTDEEIRHAISRIAACSENSNV